MWEYSGTRVSLLMTRLMVNMAGYVKTREKGEKGGREILIAGLT